MRFQSLSIGLVAAALAPLASAQFTQTSSLAYPPGTVFFFVDKELGNNANGGSATDPWRDLSTGYANMLSAMSAFPTTPAALIVAPGYYAPSSGESFPLDVVPLRFIGGENAHTTIVSLESNAGIAFRFNGSLAAGAVYSRNDGPYLERLTIRNTEPTDFSQILLAGDAIRLNAPPADVCQPTRPVLNQLIIYGFNFAIRGEFVGPLVVDSTIVRNNTGLFASPNGGAAGPCCGDRWDVINSVVSGNSARDLANMALGNVTFTSFDDALTQNCVNPQGVTVLTPTQGTGTTNPDYVAGPDYPAVLEPTFVSAPPLVSPTPNPVTEFDMRLLAASPLRADGAWATTPILGQPLWDAEGFMNLRLELTATTNADIGADQFNSLRVGPLTRVFTGGGSLGLTRAGIDLGAPNSLVDMVSTPLGTSQPVVLAIPVLTTPVPHPVLTGVFIAPFSTTPGVIPSGGGLVFQELFGIVGPVTLGATTMASTSVEVNIPLVVTVTGLPLTMQMGYVEVLPSGDISTTFSNGQKFVTH